MGVDSPLPNCHNSFCTQQGDVAQLGERCLRKAEAEGSNPFISTMIPPGPIDGALFMSGRSARDSNREVAIGLWPIAG